MDKQLSLAIPKPCSEKWSNFTPTLNGGFCTSCSKVVIDFTTMDDEEIFKFFSNRPDHTCGRFKPHQLREYAYGSSRTIRPGLGLVKTGVLSLLLLLMSKQQGPAQDKATKTKTEFVSHPESREAKFAVTSREHLIKGVVKAEDGLPLPGVNVILKGSDIGTVADADGYFEFPQKLNEGDVLVVSFIGYVTTEYKVPKQAPEVVEISLTLDFEIMGEVLVGQVYGENPSGFYRLLQKIKQWF